MRSRLGPGVQGALHPFLRLFPLFAVVILVAEAGASSYLSATTTGSITWSPSPDPFPQILHNASGAYSSSTSLGTGTSEVNVSLSSNGVEFQANPTPGGYTLTNVTARIYAAPKFAGAVVYNGTPAAWAGYSVTAINLTGDGSSGVSAVVIGAPHAQVAGTGCGGWESGAVFIFFGHTPLNGSYNTYQNSPTTLDQANVTICGNETGMELGAAVAGVKNLTGPGASGLAIGATNFTWCAGATTNLGSAGCSPAAAPHGGSAWLVFPQRQWFWHKSVIHEVVPIGGTAGIYNWVVYDTGAATRGEEMGFSLSSIENSTSSEVANPGYDDVIVGAPYLNTSSGMGVGEDVVLSGVTATTLTIASIENPSARPNSHFGWAVANVTDLGGANRQDIAVGAPGSDTVYLYAGDYLPHDAGVGLPPDVPLARIPGRPGTSFGWSLAGIGRPPGGAAPEVAVGAPQWSDLSLSTITNSTMAQFQSQGSSLASSGKANNIAAYSSAVAPTTLNLTASTLTNSFTWTTFTGTGCTLGSSSSVVAVPGTTSIAVTDTSTSCSAWEYTEPTFPSVGVIEAYVDVASGDGLNIYLGYTQVTSGPNTVGVEPLGGISFTAGGKIAYSTFTSAGPTAYGGWQTPEQGMAYQHNSWYKVDIVYSAVTFQYDLWVNNVLVGENLTFWEGPDAPLEIVLGSCVQDGGCYQGNTATVTAYVDDLSVQEYSTQTQGIYTSSLIPNFPGTVENATVSWNATVPIHTSLQVEVTNGALSGGSPVWVHVPSSGANVSFLDEGASQQFGYRLLFYSTDPRYSPLFFSLRATIGTIAVSGVGETAVFDSTGLNLSGTVTASTYSDFLTKGSSLSTGPVPYAPGDPGNNTLDPSGVLDNGHLELSLEEGFQDNFDTPASTSAGTTGNYSITEYRGGTAPTWSESSTASVSAPNSANYVETASGGLVYNYYGIQGTSGDAISAGQFSFDLRIASGGASILGGGVSGKSLYTVFAVTFQAGLTSVTDGTVFNSNVRFTYHTGVWYSCLFTFNNVANTFSFYINASNGILAPLATGYADFNAVSVQYAMFSDNSTAANYFVDNVEVGRAVWNGTYLSSTTAVPGYISGVRVFNNSTIFPGTDVQIEVSRDGGANWSAPLANRTFYTFDRGEPNGNQLRYRVLLHTNGYFDPILWDVEVHYYYVQPFVKIFGNSGGDQFGYALSSGGDEDQDGGMDLVVGAPNAGGSGTAYIFYANNWVSGAELTASSANTKYLGQITGDRFGESVFAERFNASAPYPPTQVLVGAPLSAANVGSAGAGRVYLFGSSPPTLNLTLNYTTPTAHGMIAWGQVEVISAQMWNVVMTTTWTDRPPNQFSLPLGASLFFNLSDRFLASADYGAPSVTVWLNSAYWPVASNYYVGFYIRDP